jgi:phage FluMu gp28-like protein
MSEVHAGALRDNPATFARAAFDVTLFEYQEDFVGTGAKRKSLVCGRQVGKTEVCALDGLHHASTHADTTVLITAPTQRQSSELFKRVKDLVGRASADWGVERSTQTIIELKNGSRIICLPSGTDGNSIRGYTADYIIVDEAAFVEDTVFTSVLLPMLATTDGTLALASTPFGKSGFLYEEAWTGDDWHITHVPSYESPLVDESFIEEQKATLTRTEYRQEIEGEFVESADAYFDRDTVRSVIDADATLQPDRGVTLGVDLARHGQDRTVIMPVDTFGTVGRIRSSADWSLTQGVAETADCVDRWDVTQVVVDETGMGGKPVEDLKHQLGSRLVEGVKFTIDRKASHYNALKSAMQNGAVALPDHDALRRELVDLEYELTRGGKTRIHHPDGGHDDHTDALALAWHGHTGSAEGTRITGDNVVVL